VFAFITSREFRRSDFPESIVNVRRIARPVIGEMLAKCLLPDRDILDAATWLRDLVMRHGAARRADRNATLAVCRPSNVLFSVLCSAESMEAELKLDEAVIEELERGDGNAKQIAERLSKRVSCKEGMGGTGK
jgi:hypothetical protein